MKLLGMCLVFGGCLGIGLYYRMQELFRYRNLQEIQKAMDVLRGEISSVKSPLPEAVYQASKRTRGVMSSFFAEVAGELEEGQGELSRIWSQKLKDGVPGMQLCEGDRMELERMGEMLGYLDTEMQKRSIDLYMERVRQSIQDMERNDEKRSRLYPVLGTAAGILLCILMV